MHIVIETSKHYLVCENHVHMEAFLFQIKKKWNKTSCIFACLMLFYFRKGKTQRK